MMWVTVLMPMRNAEPYVQEALGSVLGPPGPGFELEVVVIDDGSTDGSRPAVVALGGTALAGGRVRVIDGPRCGVSAALNAGLAAARGEVVMRCDADDLYEPGRIGRQAAWLAEHGEFGAVCGRFSTMTRRGAFIASLNSGGQEEEITGELRRAVTRTSLCTFAMRTEVVRRIGGFREYFVTGEDIDLQLRLGEACRVWYLPSDEYIYRLHEASITHTQPNSARDFFERTARTFQVQRQERGRDDLELGHPPEPPRCRDAASPAARQVQGMLVGRAWQEHRLGHQRQALWTGMRACAARPWSAAGWWQLALLAIKSPVQRKRAGEGRS